ncbi:MAG: uroporphyrinogen decarboxylase family protein [Planctomycetota bacterium]
MTHLRNARDNLLRAIRFERPDYIPMVFHVNSACWHHYPQQALIDLMQSHSFLFPDFKPPALPFVPDYPPYARAGVPFVDPWGCVWETDDDGLLGIVTKHPLEDWAAFDRYEPPDPSCFNHYGPVDWDTLAAADTPMGFFPCLPSGEIGHGHTFLKLCDLRGYTNLLVDMADDEPRLPRLIDMAETFNAGLVRNFIERARVELLGFAEDLGMQCGPMLSPEHFRRYILPSYRRLMSPARDAACIVHMHSDGDIRALIDDLVGRVDVINLQDLVNGIDWIRARLAGRVCIDLDIDRQQITPRGRPADVDALVREEVEKLGSPQGGLMMIYGLYPGVPLENVKALMDAMEKYATYYS